MRRRPSAFTLIELMIIVAIIGILTAIAIPKFASLIRSSGEANGKGNLASLRSALNVYYGDLEGQYPPDLAALTVSSKYLSDVPATKTPYYHADSSSELDGGISAFNDAGGWLFNNNATDPNVVELNVNCTDTDTKGSVWSAY